MLSAHRTPDQATRFAARPRAAASGCHRRRGRRRAPGRGGGRAHDAARDRRAPGQLAARGFDALLSTVQMPPGIPVATVGVGRDGRGQRGAPRGHHPRPRRSRCARAAGAPAKCRRGPGEGADLPAGASCCTPRPDADSSGAGRPPRPGPRRVLGFALNVAGMSWGLPARWHPDEKADARAHGRRRRPRPRLLGQPLAPALRDARSGVLTGPGAAARAAARPCERSAVAGPAALGGRGRRRVLVLGLAAWRSPRRWGRCPRPARALPRLREPVPLRHTGAVAPAGHGRDARSRGPARGRPRAPRGPGLALGLTASTKYTAAALAAPVPGRRVAP